MKRMTLAGALIVLALALAACAPAPATEAPTLSVPVTGDTETPEFGITETVLPTGTATSDAAIASPTSDSGMATTETAPTTTGTGLTISASNSAGFSEPFLVDQEGRTLYLFTSDTQNSGTSSCTGDCLAEWPPVAVVENPQAGEGVDAALLGTITRDDGSLQAAYNGWPLYYYTGDAAPGDVNGQGLGGVWYLVSGAGNAIQQ